MLKFARQRMLGAPAQSPSQVRTSRVRLLAALLGCLALGLAGEGLWELGTAGFPDGHLTQYDRALRAPLAVLSGLSAVCSLYFFWLCRTAARPGSAARLAVAASSFLLLVPGARWGLEYGLRHFTTIDHGQGG
jgi:hypothetical protein